MSSTTQFPITSTYGLQEITGMMLCNESFCKNAATDLFNGITNEVLVPRSSVVVIREHRQPTNASLQLIPRLSREHLYLTINDIIILKPVFPKSCHDVNITINISSKHATKLILSANLTNEGKV